MIEKEINDIKEKHIWKKFHAKNITSRKSSTCFALDKYE